MSLLGGSFGALLLSPDAVTVGASGAVFGMMGAAIIAMRARGIDPMQSGLGMTLVLNLGITFLIPGISIGGHIGGLVAGGIVGYLMFEVGRPAPRRADAGARRVRRAGGRAGRGLRRGRLERVAVLTSELRRAGASYAPLPDRSETR